MSVDSYKTDTEHLYESFDELVQETMVDVDMESYEEEEKEER